MTNEPINFDKISIEELRAMKSVYANAQKLTSKRLAMICKEIKRRNKQ